MLQQDRSNMNMLHDAARVILCHFFTIFFNQFCHAPPSARARRAEVLRDHDLVPRLRGRDDRRFPPDPADRNGAEHLAENSSYAP